MAAAETLLEAGNVRLKRCRHGAFLYNIHDKFIGRSLDLYGEFSEGEAAMFAQILKPGMVAMDVGANIGVHTVFMAQAVGSGGAVFAFEPQRVVHQLLCANLALNSLNNVMTWHAAVGPKAGTIIVPPIRYDLEGNFGGVALGDHERGETVPVVALDALPLRSCHFIKIDVEGMEAQVLEGARQMIARLRPILYVENDRKEKSQALIEALFAMDYRLYWHNTPLFNPNNFFAKGENLFGNIVSRNMLCVPKESPTQVTNLPEITDAATGL